MVLCPYALNKTYNKMESESTAQGTKKERIAAEYRGTSIPVYMLRCTKAEAPAEKM